MSSLVSWDFRTDKVLQAIREGKRLDARAFDQYRKINIVKNISENADGSARVKIGETDVIVGVKMITSTPFPDSPDAGTLNVGVELLPIASPTFEAGPPDKESIELARVVDRGIRESKCLDFKEWSIEEGTLCWTAFVDIYALNHDGNLFDAAALASIVSLLETKMPKLEDKKIVKGEYKGKIKLSRKPLLCTFAKIANSVVADPSLPEEKAQSARFSVAVTEDDYLTAFQKGGLGSFTASEIDSAIDIALKNTKEIRKQI
ncbi:MAG: exosome complex protein Rrp42 [Candidatus Diapherotrites archaeon]|uniref:Exosome complex protein Rrp42 n=1 Tax=Candidatus Iainarchaeum sp. TaxID=3101447 RepID=A0A7J4JVU3_9ARCH|nr:MAG: exosome complex component RRP42 [archaeon GW2011_AR21]MBS3058234.1 exosome complex protein Rrp42 [Candidatus Diapherotrites archaeon]HIH21902.1 exosome complex protein Rrp42 [Candidatus Diapherotrites archaeon]HIH33546.1 exosome complex protein Rrp42 [Candidatus Diapherotrites archaeon]